MPDQIRPTTATVDLSRLRSNFRAVQAEVGSGVRVLAAVKGDAYGHGAVHCALALQEEGCSSFGVALVEEGKALRRSGVTGQVICLGGVGPAGAEEAVGWDLTPMVYDLDTAARLSAVGSARGRAVGVHLKVDTGMGRLGVPLGEWEPFLDRLASLPGLTVEGIASHLAEAEADDPTFTLEQDRRFRAALAAARGRAWEPSQVHLANSAGALRFPDLRHSMVRVGLALYGLAPYPGCAVDLKPVMRVSTRVLFVKNVPARFGVSYGRTWVPESPRRLATLPVGYADGYPRALSNRAEVLVHGHRCPVRGVVCMDLTLVDVTEVPDEVRPGDEVVLLGDAPAAHEVASWAGTIPYEVLCGFSERVPRAFGEAA